MRYFNFKPSKKLDWYHTQVFLGSQIAMTTGGFEHPMAQWVR